MLKHTLLELLNTAVRSTTALETSVTINQSTPRNIPEDLNFRQRENLKFRSFTSIHYTDIHRMEVLHRKETVL